LSCSRRSRRRTRDRRRRIKTRFTELSPLFGIEHPIVQGGMQWVGRAELVAAVANAGALGIHHRAHPADAGRPGQGDRALPHDDRQAVRREPDHPAGGEAAALRRVSRRDHRERRQGIVETAGYKPQEHVDDFKKHGVKVIHKCTAVRHAL
jgi:NAD(P)H-dependent flavin oxidoreductase YrpB (nitropropane dioxygenase family)